MMMMRTTSVGEYAVVRLEQAREDLLQAMKKWPHLEPEIRRIAKGRVEL